MKLTDAERTRLLAEGVMGWVLCDRGGWPHDFWGIPSGPDRHLMDRRLDWSPLTNEAHAAEVRERMRALGWWWEIETGDKHDWVRVGRGNNECHFDVQVALGHIPRGISHAALLALGLATEEQL
jgi:hypothetical protein